MRTACCCVLLLAGWASGGWAQGPPDAAARAKIIAPLLEETTVGLAYLDLTRIEPEPLVNDFVELVPEARDEQREMVAKLRQALDAFRQAGGRDVYLVVSLADVPSPAPPWLAIVPLAPDAKPEALSALARSLGASATERVGQVLLAGSEEALRRQRSLQPDQRPELVAAFETAGSAEVQLLVLPPKHAARVVEEMMPTLPREIGDGPSTVVTHGLRWAAVGFDPPPKTAFRLTIQSQDRQAAELLRAKLLEAFRLLGQTETVKKRLPKIEEILALSTPEVHGDRLVLTLNEENRGVSALVAALKPSLEEIRKEARRHATMNNLRMIGLALHSYHDAHKTFPANAKVSADGKPLLSWRVQILPFLDQQDLYKQFHLDEPWDSAHNRQLIERMPAVFRSPAAKLKDKGLTTYLVPVHKDSVFPDRKAVSIKDITDGTSSTIMVVAASDARAVIWTKPDDLPLDLQEPAKGLGGPIESGFCALFCDGSVQFLPLPQDPKNLRALFTRAGGEPASR